MKLKQVTSVKLLLKVHGSMTYTLQVKKETTVASISYYMCLNMTDKKLFEYSHQSPNLSLMNITLLSKWNWRYANERETLWK